MELIQNRISQYKELSPLSKEHEESIDVIVPDINPDVLEIVYTTGSCTIREKQTGASLVTLAGDIYIKVFYRSEGDDRLYSLGGQIPFSYNYEAAGALPSDIAVVSVNVAGTAAHALNPRKLSLKAEIGTDTRIFQSVATEFVVGADGEADEGIHTLATAETRVYLSAIPEKRIAFNEEIRVLAGNIAESDRIIRSELIWSDEDIKVLAGKVMLRGSAAVKVITIPENGGQPAENTYKLPFSSIIECDSIAEGDSARVEFQTLQFETQLITRGEDELYLYCNIFGNATVFAEKSAEITLLEDIFSTSYALFYETEDIPGGLCEPGILQTDASSIIEVEVPASQIYDYSYTARARCMADMVSGNFYFRVLYENQNGQLAGASRRVDVEVPFGGACQGAFVGATAEQVAVTVDAVGAIQISFNAVFTVAGECGRTRRQIKSCSIDRDRPLGRVRDATLVLRAIELGESVWSIAKQYRTSPTAILSANKLESESELRPGKLIIIPFVE